MPDRRDFVQQAKVGSDEANTFRCHAVTLEIKTRRFPDGSQARLPVSGLQHIEKLTYY
ncbi:hypothetical protein PAMC26577_31160 [Caballeronia sordidicola]|uniref:Uncharacterized protein n=1 Tax=Caballeronia sordidicola TaxID=196367 RepID=A0A242MFJ1_CABSO|nr:hypothetical protein PAMC26577_31160 [Caballeronia sordidicola]